MPLGRMSEVIDHLRHTVQRQPGADLTDGQLLECFVSGRSSAALEALVARHAPMVWGVCRRLLRNERDAEDAFQATFLVLLRKAPSISPREMVGNWLYGVAHQTARKAIATLAKRRTREKQVADLPDCAAPAQAAWDDLQPVLDHELSRLSDKYRVAIVLCDLEGKSRQEAARQLGLPEGTVASRLARARTMLARRLAQRGVVLSAGAVAAVLAEWAAAGAPAGLVAATVQVLRLVTTGHTMAALAVSANVATIAEGVIHATSAPKLKSLVTAVALLLGASFGGVSLHQVLANPDHGAGRLVLAGRKTLAIQPIGGERKAIDPDTISAYQKLGAIYGGGLPHFDFHLVFEPGKDSAEKGVPAFSFKSLPNAALPPVAVPFGLSLGQSDLTDSALKEVGRLTNLTWLSLDNTGITDNGLKALTPLKNLTHLELSGTKISDVGLKEVGRLNALSHLTLVFVPITDAGVKELQPLTKLRSLMLTGTQVTDAGMKEVAVLKDLTALALDHTQITDDALKELKQLGHLTFLSLQKTRVSDAGLVELATLAKVSSLYLDQTSVSDAGLQKLTALKNLTKIGLGETPATDAGMKALARLSGLKGVYLNGTKITDSGLKTLSGLDGLAELVLNDTGVSDVGLTAFASHKNLTYLSLFKTKVTSTGIKSLTNLTGLNVSDMTNTDMKNLAQLTKLTTLQVFSSDVTDAGLKELAALKNLTTLDLVLTQTTEAGVAALRKTLPSCTIRVTD